MLRWKIGGRNKESVVEHRAAKGFHLFEIEFDQIMIFTGSQVSMDFIAGIRESIDIGDLSLCRREAAQLADFAKDLMCLLVERPGYLFDPMPPLAEDWVQGEHVVAGHC